MGDETFDANDFEQKLTKLKDTQEGIQGLSAWCLQKRSHHKKIVATWLNVLKNVRVEHRLTLFYLANDVIQHSKRKNYEFVDSWGTALQRATTMVRDEKVKHKILRIFKIWGERSVYNEEFLSDLNGLLSMAPPKMKPKDPNVDPDEFQVQTVVQHIRKCVVLQGETDRSLKSVVKTELPDVDGSLKTIKDRAKVKELQKEVDESVRRYERYMTNLQRELKTRQALIETLQEADEFYQTQRGEVKVVAGAYKNFGNRVKALKKKLDEMAGTLPSPIPSPPANAPSPGPDTDFDLPTTAFGFTNGSFIGSYMDTSLPFDPMDFTRKSPSPQSIQVINNSTMSDSYSTTTDTINDFFKTLIPDSYDPAASFSTDYSLSDINMSYTGVPAPTPLPSYAPITMSSYGMSNRRDTTPLQPPPAPPNVQQWQDTGGGNDDGWIHSNQVRQGLNWLSQPLQSSIFNDAAAAVNAISGPKDLETPHSPPHYDRKAPSNIRPIEYVDMDTPDEQTGTNDVDHRSLALDVHHSNLISLTGSPGAEPPASNSDVGDDIDLRGSKSEAPPLPTESSPQKDEDFRLPAPPLPLDDTDGDLRALFSSLPPMLEPPSLGDLEKLLDGDDKEPLRKRNGQNSNDPGIIVDMDLSDDDKDVVLIEDTEDLSEQVSEEPPLPIIPGFGDYDDWSGNNEAYDPDPDEQQHLGNNSYGDNSFNNYGQPPQNHWNAPPPPPAPPAVIPPYNQLQPPRWGGGLLPAPPPLMHPQQQRFMQMGGGGGGGRPPFSPRNGPPNNFNNFNSPHSGGYRGSPRGGRGMPYFRGGNHRGRFNRGRGRW